MHVLVIPDIHLKPWIFDRAEKILKDGKRNKKTILYICVKKKWGIYKRRYRYNKCCF